MEYNPPIYNQDTLMTMTEKEVLVAQYQLQLSTVSLLVAVLIYILIFTIFKWILPKYWYRPRETV